MIETGTNNLTPQKSSKQEECCENGCGNIRNQSLKPRRAALSDVAYLCYKCKVSNATTNIREKACKKCFLEFVVKKFKISFLESCKEYYKTMIRFNSIPMSEIVFCLSGGTSSLVLIDLFHKILVDNKNRNSSECKPRVIHVSIPSIYYNSNTTGDTYMVQLNNIVDYLEKFYNFPITILELGSHLSNKNKICMRNTDGQVLFYFTKSYSSYEIEELHSSLSLQYGKYFRQENVSTTVVNTQIIILNLLADLFSTHPEDALHFIRIIVHRDIYEFSRKNNIKLIFHGSSAERLSQIALNTLCGGGGINLRNNVSLCDKRLDEFCVCRPLRIFSRKEVFLYHYFVGLQNLPFSFELKDDTILSIKRDSDDIFEHKTVLKVIEEFLNNLEDKNKSIPFVINKTCDKIQPICYLEHKASTHGDYCDQSVQNKISCKVCYGFVENSFDQDNFIPEWNLNQLGVLEELPEEIFSNLCFECKRLASSSRVAARICVLLTE